MQVVDRYFSEMATLKRDCCYLECAARKFETQLNWFDGCLAVMSTASVATWAVWKAFPLLWGALIATSQVLSVVKVHFPFAEKRKLLIQLSSRHNHLFNRMEAMWFRIAAGDLTVQQISDELLRSKVIVRRAPSPVAIWIRRRRDV